MLFALILAAIGLLVFAWPEGLVRAARLYRGAMPKDRTPPVVHAARIGGMLLLVFGLLLALALG